MAVGAAEKFVPQAIFKAPAEGARHFLQALFAGDGSVQSQKHKGEEGPRVEYYSNSRRLVEDVHHLLLRFGIVSLIRSKITAIGTTAHRVQITDRQEVLRFAERVGFWPGSKKQVRLESLTPGLLARGRGRSNVDTLPPEAWGLLRLASRGAGRSLASVGIRPTLAQSVPLPFARQAGTLLGARRTGRVGRPRAAVGRGGVDRGRRIRGDLRPNGAGFPQFPCQWPIHS